MLTKFCPIAAILVFFAFPRLSAQEKKPVFTNDTANLLEELTQHFKTAGNAEAAEAKLVLSTFTYQWTSNLLTDVQKKQSQSVCIAMNDQKLKVAPYYILYLNILTSLVKKSSLPEEFDLFHKSILFCLKDKNPSRTLLQYLSQAELLINSNALMKTSTEAWFVRNATFKIAFDSVPHFVFSQGSLACVVRNDSICINETKGDYYPLSQTWKGEGGIANWERTGLDPDVVFVKLARYKINTRTIAFAADSAQLFHKGYFKDFLMGKFEDKAMVDITPERATFPKFTMYHGNSVYINLFKDIEYFGSFNLEGSRVHGGSTLNDIAVIEIKHNQKPLITFRASEFVIRPDKFVSARASAVIYIENDSIFHPGLHVRYNLASNELVMSRADEGLAQSPFFDSYHKLDMYSEAIYWKLEDDFMDFEAIKGVRSKSEALFESSDYFSAYRFDKLQGIDEVNPAVLVANYARRNNTDRFYSDDFAFWVKKPIEQVRVQLIKLANAGFIIFDFKNDFSKIQPRLNEYLAAKSGVKDSDIIQFQSFVEKGYNARLDLRTNRLLVEGVQKVMLSDSQYVYVVPRDGKVTVSKNRDFSFTGRVHAGLFDLMANECTFQYEKFALFMPHIDSVLMAVESWDVDANGYRKFVRVKNVLAAMNADLFIDSPQSKSGRKMLHQFPLLISKDTSYVFFQRNDIVKGVYKKKNFYFQVNPFSMDSINSLPSKDMRFDGKFVSAGIFPDIIETIKVQKDYSLGFKRMLQDSGLPVYGGKGRFADTLKLSNSGLQGSGRLTYLNSVTSSDEFLFMPDSTSAKVKDYQLAKVAGQIEFPDAKVKEATALWSPGSDLMTVKNAGKDVFDMFDKRATLKGELNVSPTGLKGKGLLAFDNAEVESKTYSFKNESFTSDTSDFRILTEDKLKEALQVHIYRTDIDFKTNTGHFEAIGKGALMKFPFIKYNCVVDQFDWLMGKNQLQLINKTGDKREKYSRMTQEELIRFKPGAEVYTSTDPKQDSLTFFAMNAIYDLSTNLMEVEKARIIKVADAAIFLGNGKLTVGNDGLIRELKLAEIIADTANLYQRFYNASVKIASKHSFSAKGLYDYTPSDGEVATLEMKDISVNGKGETQAQTSVTDSMNFLMNRYFRYKGGLQVNASSKLIGFNGGFSFVHDCFYLPKEWIKLNAELDPKNIMIPVTNDPENLGNGNLRVSVFYSLTENKVKPGFFVKPDNVTDTDILAAGGLLVYNPQKSEYIVAQPDKIKNPQLTGSLLSINTARCALHGEGLMKLATNLGHLRMNSAGEINYFSLVDSTSLNMLGAFDFFFSNDAMNAFADALNAAELKGIDISNIKYTRSLREFVGQQEADKILKDLSLSGYLRKFPDTLNHTIVLTNVNMYFDKEQKSYFSYGPIGISNIGKTPVNKYVKGYLEIGKRRTGDIINLYLEADEKQWYFFAYANNTMQAISSNTAFNDKILGLKEDQRLIKGENGHPSYQFILGTADKKATFLRKMKQMEGDR